MSGHSLRHVVNIDADRAKVRHALTTAEGLKGWTMADVAGEGGAGSEWVLTYGKGPTFKWKVTAHEGDTVAWTCTEGPGDSVGTTATFHLGSEPRGRVQLTFDHAGWPHQEGNFAKCNSLWGAMMHHLRAYAENGTVASPLN
jgi:uncharacterized protein YndB with AHSA1/START domain